MHLKKWANARLASCGAALATVAVASGWMVADPVHAVVGAQADESRAAGTQEDESAEIFRETKTLTVTHEANKPLNIETDFGSIEVRQGGEDMVSIEAEVASRTEDRLDAITVSAARGPDGALTIRPDWGDQREEGDGVSFIVTIPDASVATLRCDYGAILLNGLDCSIIAETDFGPIELMEVGGPVEATTAYGPIHVRQQSSAAGPVRARTEMGGVTVELGEAFEGTMVASTTIGSFEIDAIGDLVEGYSGSTVGGKTVTFTVGDAGASESWVKTVNGPVRIFMRK